MILPYYGIGSNECPCEHCPTSTACNKMTGPCKLYMDWEKGPTTLKFPDDYLGNIFNCDCMEIMKTLPDKSVSLVLTDPPYGIGEDGGACRTRGSSIPKHEKMGWDNKTPEAVVFNEIIRISKNQVIWGGNYFTDKLPVSRGWLYWEKLMGGDFSDGELAWTSRDKVLKQFTCCNKGSDKVHPTQKPDELFRWVLNMDDEYLTVFDPFMGSGTTAVACERLGRKWFGCELVESYCRIAEKRIAAERAQLKLF